MLYWMKKVETQLEGHILSITCSKTLSGISTSPRSTKCVAWQIRVKASTLSPSRVMMRGPCWGTPPSMKLKFSIFLNTEEAAVRMWDETLSDVNVSPSFTVSSMSPSGFGCCRGRASTMLFKVSISEDVEGLAADYLMRQRFLLQHSVVR